MPPRRDEATIFNVARRIGGPEARRVYLRVACGDDDSLCRRVEALIRVHDDDPSSLTSPTFVKRVRADLDHVVMKCLEDDHAGRYESADELAHDIERQLNAPPPLAGNWISRLLRKLRNAFSHRS